jgi:hypothetical protein
MNSDLYAHYEAVLNAEKSERDRLCAEIKRLNALLKQKDAAIAALTASINVDNVAARAFAKPLPFAQPVGLGAQPQPTVPDNQIYASISVRWAILKFMADHTPTGETRSIVDMAEALTAGGVRSGGVNFAANVSAVVSAMKNKTELEAAGDGKFRITTHGRDVWQSIKTSRQYTARQYGWVSEGWSGKEGGR